GTPRCQPTSGRSGQRVRSTRWRRSSSTASGTSTRNSWRVTRAPLGPPGGRRRPIASRVRVVDQGDRPGKLESFTMRTYGGGVTTTAPISDAALLREHGLRVTAGRLAVLSALGRSPHVDAETIRQRLGHAAPSLQAVHNILADLTEAGLVRRFE